MVWSDSAEPKGKLGFVLKFYILIKLCSDFSF